MREERRRNIRNIYIPERSAWIIQAVAKLAEKEGRSVSNMILRLLLEALQARGEVKRT